MDLINVAKGIRSSTPSVEYSGHDLLAQFSRLEEAWKKAEALLASSHVPCEVRVQVSCHSVSNDIGPNERVTTYLAYRKVKGKWRISVVEETEFPDVPDEVGLEPQIETKPVVECPVDVRLEMLDWFDKLYAEVVLATDRYVPKIAKAIKKFEEHLAALEG